MGSLRINSFWVIVAIAAGLIFGLAISQTNKDKNIDAANLIAPLKSASASPNTPLQTQALVKALPEKTENNSGRPAAAKTANAEKSILRLKDYIKNTEEKSTFLKEKVELLNDLLNSKGKELAKLNTDNAILKENLNKTVELQNKLKADLEAQVSGLNNQLAQRETDITGLNTVKSGLENQLLELNNKFASLAADSAVLQDKLVLLEQEKSSLQEKLIRVKEDLDRQEAINEALNKNVSGLTVSLDAKEKERSEIANELQQLKDAKAGRETELNRMAAIKADDDGNIKQLNSRIAELNGLYEEAKKSLFQMSGMLADKEQLANDRQNEIAALRDNLTKSDGGKGLLLASLDEKEKTVRDLNLALASMESRIAALQKDLAAEKERQAAAASQLAEAVSSNRNLKERMKNIYIELELIRAGKTER